MVRSHFSDFCIFCSGVISSNLSANIYACVFLQTSGRNLILERKMFCLIVAIKTLPLISNVCLLIKCNYSYPSRKWKCEKISFKIVFTFSFWYNVKFSTAVKPRSTDTYPFNSIYIFLIKFQSNCFFVWIIFSARTFFLFIWHNYDSNSKCNTV